jgi:hypothetical protein
MLNDYESSVPERSGRHQKEHRCFFPTMREFIELGIRPAGPSSFELTDNLPEDALGNLDIHTGGSSPRESVCFVPGRIPSVESAAAVVNLYASEPVFYFQNRSFRPNAHPAQNYHMEYVGTASFAQYDPRCNMTDRDKGKTCTFDKFILSVTR